MVRENTYHLRIATILKEGKLHPDALGQMIHLAFCLRGDPRGFNLAELGQGLANLMLRDRSTRES